MICMICKNEVDDNEKMCPNCGAMPWQTPEFFLNADQHQKWLSEVYKPQLARWEKMQKLQKENDILKQRTENLIQNEKYANEIIGKVQQQLETAVQAKNETETENYRIKQQLEDLTKVIGELQQSSTYVQGEDFQESEPIQQEDEYTYKDFQEYNSAEQIQQADRYEEENLKNNYVVIIGEGRTIINAEEFKERQDLKSIIISDTVTSIGKHAFYGCENLHRVISDSITSIGPNAFSYCTSLQSIIIPESVTYIGEGAFIH